MKKDSKTLDTDRHLMELRKLVDTFRGCSEGQIVVPVYLSRIEALEAGLDALLAMKQEDQEKNEDKDLSRSGQSSSSESLTNATTTETVSDESLPISDEDATSVLTQWLSETEMLYEQEEVHVDWQTHSGVDTDNCGWCSDCSVCGAHCGNQEIRAALPQR